MRPNCTRSSINCFVELKWIPVNPISLAMDTFSSTSSIKIEFSGRVPANLAAVKKIYLWGFRNPTLKEYTAPSIK